MQLSDSMLAALNDAAGREDHLVPLRAKVPYVSQLNACRALERRNLVASVRVKASTLAIVTVANDKGYTGFKVTKAGLAAINVADEPATATAPAVSKAPAAPAPAAEQTSAPEAAAASAPRSGASALRQAAAAVVTAYDGIITPLHNPPLAAALAGLRAALAASGGSGAPREGTKAAQVLALLSRPEGATNEQVQAAMGWNNNTVRGFFAGLRKKGTAISTSKPEAGTLGAAKAPTVYRLQAAA